MVSRRDSKKALQSVLNRNNLINTWKQRLERRQREVTTITSLLYNQLCIILNKVLFVDKQLYAASRLCEASFTSRGQEVHAASHDSGRRSHLSLLR